MSASTPDNAINWRIFESEEALQKDLKIREGEEALRQYLRNNHPDRRSEADLADAYRVWHHKHYERPSEIGYTCIEVLQHLYGKPWNNEALNWMASLRPSAIRVSSGSVTLDACLWRVTVWLEEGDSTIRRIDQEVEVGKYGHGIYQDVSENPPSAGMAIVNEHAIKNIIVG